MSSLSVIGTAVMIFIVAAMLFYQSRPTEGFADATPKDPAARWQPPVAGRRYNPQTTYDRVPADLIKAPQASIQGSIPLSQQRPSATPGTGTATAPREAMAQLRDLYDLDNKITLWLDAAGQKEREQPGSLTAKQLQERVMLQGRLAEIRDQVGTGMITDTWKSVADETMRLRTENAGWQVRSPSLEAVYEFGKGKNPDDLLTHDDYVTFYGLFNAALNELQGLSQPDPLQKVRLQQLQVMRRDLMDTAAKVTTPPIRFSAATLYLRQMLKADQPLPTLFSMEPVSATNQLVNNPMDVLAYLRDIQLDLTVRYDPASQELKRAAAAMMNRVQAGQMSAQEARGHLATFHAQKGPVAFGANPGTNIRAGQKPTQGVVAAPEANSSRQNLITRAQTLCNQVRTAFPTDADALGCRPVNTEYDAETVINTVCDRIRWSAPTVTPEQFNCPPKTV